MTTPACPLAQRAHGRLAQPAHPQRLRVVGAHAVNGTPPPYAWSIGGTRRRQDWAEGRPAARELGTPGDSTS